VQGDDGTVGPTGQYEQHISGDVSFAFAQYWAATTDKQYLSSVSARSMLGV